ncbi:MULTISPECIES: pentapeptide repeat-containing protein [unclassified Rathayibacter]|uniref:pentapeptide repeat-containing protein n=1 Tax=unclassified Rathayibacter TaxID=2609250 RepID=UPI000CE8EAA0|nr:MULTISPECIES: pentapeptide repeat-containing protein [unclassified Rathayibacter]PPG48050.1 pentapeptide repeat-containing protein [Rathayibacter sp. AY2B3]PPI27884.1 pentapeptide repeat-containing protein [Rathayibacter sp. AY1B5]
MRDATAPPRLDPLLLDGLAEGCAGDTGAREHAEGLRFTGTDLTGTDLTAASFSECVLAGVVLDGAQLRAASITESRLERLDVPGLSAPRSRLRSVELLASRLGSGELYESTWEQVRVADCKLGYLNLRGATVRDVLLERCTIDELDLAGATGTRLRLVDCDVRSLDLSRARIEHLDLRGAGLHVLTGLDGLRGATLSELQLSLLLPLFAEHFGVRVG